MIEDLNKRFRVDVVDAPSTEADIEGLKRFSPIPIPEFYIELIKQGSDYEILVDNEMYIRFWGAAGCLDMNPGYEIQENLGPCLAIGDDEGGQAFILMPETEGYPAGLYLMDFGALFMEDARFIAKSLDDLLIKGDGAEAIYGN